MKSNNLKRTVLSVDDDEVNQMVISSFLEGSGFNVVQAFDGTECLDYLANAFSEPANGKDAIPDIILLDVIMPGMDGHQVCRTIRRRYPSTLPVIMISAKGSKQDTISGLSVSLANDYLSKPFDRSILLAKMECLISLADSMRSTAAHKRDDFCAEIYRPVYCPSHFGRPVAVILFRASLTGNTLNDVLSNLQHRIAQSELELLGLQQGMCIVSSQSADVLVSTCFTMFTASNNCEGVSRNMFCFIMDTHLASVADVLRTGLQGVPEGGIQCTDRFYRHLNEENQQRFSSAPRSSAKLLADHPEPVRTLRPVDELTSRIRQKEAVRFDSSLVKSSLAELDKLFAASGASVNGQSCESESGSFQAGRELARDRLVDEVKFLNDTLLEANDQAIPARAGTADVRIERLRVAMEQELLVVEEDIHRLRAGIAFEKSNLDAIQYRLSKACRYKADLSQKLGIIDDWTFDTT